MGRKQWLDLIDLLRRILTIVRRLLADLWDGDDDSQSGAPEV